MNSRRFDWSLSRFDELDVHTLYDALALRSEVFVVEQNCAYADIDELDKLPGSRHLVARCGNTLCAYARSLAPSDTHADARIGRVVVRQSFRRQGRRTPQTESSRSSKKSGSIRLAWTETIKTVSSRISKYSV